MKTMKRIAILLAGAAVLTATHASAQTGQTVTWAGGNSYKSWLGATNWTPQVVPLNNAGTNFTVIVPDSTSLGYDSGGAGTIEALSFGISTLRVRGGNSLVVTGATVIKGLIDAQGASSAFRAKANVTVLQNYPRLWAADGATVGAAASTYTWDNNGGANTLVSSVGAGSLVELTNVTSFQVGYSGGQPVYSVYARSNGVIDLRNLGQITGPANDDWLDFNLNSSGDIRLDNLKRIAARVRFNLDLPTYTLPLLDRATETYFNLAPSNTLQLPALLSLSNGGIINAAYSRLDAPALLSVDNTPIQVGQGGSLVATNLLALDTVPLTLTSNGVFIAPKLAAYRNSLISYVPGQQLHSGNLTDIFASRLSASSGATGRVAAVTYDTPASWQWYGALFSADGGESLLDMSAMRTMQTRYCNWSGYDYRYMVNANNGGVIDLSGLETLIGPEYSNRLLEFNLKNGGNIRFPNLKQISGYTRFNVEIPLYAMPALESADNTLFVLSDGVRLQVPSLNRMAEGSSIQFGFNSTFEAPSLKSFVNSSLSLAPGNTLLAPWFTNIYASRFAVTGGSTCRVAAVIYDTPASSR